MKTKIIYDWKITKYGLEHSGFPPYEIHKSRLWEPDWIKHMEEKNWVNINSFIAALEYAQAAHKKEVKHG